MRHRRMQEKPWRRSWSVLGLLVAVMAAQAGGGPANQSTGRPMPRERNAYFGFQKGLLYLEYTLKEISRADDTASWSQSEPNGKTVRDNQLAAEYAIYHPELLLAARGSMDRLTPTTDNGYAFFDPVTLVSPYNMFPNNPTYRQNCAGLSLVKLLREAYVFPTGDAFKFVKSFDSSGWELRRLGSVSSLTGRRGDVAVYLTEALDPIHFVLLSGRGVISKDHEESVHYGDITAYPSLKPEKLIAFVGFYHLDWDQITPYRRQPVIVTVESATTHEKIPDARVELLPHQPLGRLFAVWARQKTDGNGSAAFDRFEERAGKTPEDAPLAFPFELAGGNLTVQVSREGYATARIEEPMGPRPAWNQPLRVTVRLTEMRTGWIRSGPAFESHLHPNADTTTCRFEHDDRTLTIVERLGNQGQTIRSSVTCEPPPESLQLGQRFVVRARFTPPAGHEDCGVFGQYNLEDPSFGFDDEQVRQHATTYGNFGPYQSSSGPTVITAVECLRIFGRFVSYRPGERTWFGPPADKPATIELSLQGLGGWAKLTWRYAAQAAPQALAKGSTTPQPQAPAKTGAPADQAARLAPAVAQSPTKRQNASDLNGLWSITVASQYGSGSTAARATQEGTHITFRPDPERGSFMRGILHGSNLDIEVVDSRSGVVTARGTLSYNSQADEFEGTVISTEATTPSQRVAYRIKRSDR